MADPSNPYKPGGNLAKAAVGLLGTAGLLEAWSAVFAFGLPGLNADELSLPSAAYALLSSARLMLLPITAAVFSVWWYRTRQNLSALGAFDLEYTPRAAVWSFYIPFLNLVRPVHVAQETWSGSTPNLSDNSPRGREHFRKYQLISTWWASFIIGGIAENAGMKFHDSAATVALTAIGHVLRVVSAAAAILLVVRLSRRQHARYVLRVDSTRHSNGAVAPELPLPSRAG